MTSGAAGDAAPEGRPGRIDAVPVRHPGRWVAIAVIAVLVAMFVNMLLIPGKPHAIGAKAATVNIFLLR